MDSEYLRKMTSYSINFKNKIFQNIALEEDGLTDTDVVLEKQKKRLGVNHPRITLEELGFEAIQKGNNLYRLVLQKKIKVVNCKSDSHTNLTITIQSKEKLTVCLQAGTLILPTDERCATTQSLIVRKDLQTQVSEGQTSLNIQTYCFNSELRSPNIEKYLLGNIKCTKFQTQMSQSQVWQITVKQKIVLKGLQAKYEREDYIALTKTQVKGMLDAWND